MPGPISTEPDFQAIESAALRRWADHRVFERSMAERQGGREYVFYEGPPTANGRPGLHHVWARVYKDLFCRFHTMLGEHVSRRAGWDSHGLPVEVEVEKALGLGGKREIERYGIDRFVERCRESVYAYVADWARLTERIGFWVDTDDAYWTLSSSFVQSVWWHLGRLFDDGLLFEDTKVVPYCPRCETPLSSHELGQPDVYRDIEDLAVYVRFRLEQPGPHGAEALLVWTTTPWTLLSNTGVAVNPDIAYTVVDGLVVAASRVEAVFGWPAPASATFNGSELVGLAYRRSLDLVAVPAGADGFRVVAAGFVGADEGSGLVHLAPAFGADDASMGKESGLPTLNPVGSDGRFTAAAGELAGRAVRDANAEIAARLERDGLLVRAEPHLHSYPHCWRCSTPLIYWAKPSWYVATSAHKADLMAANETVGWHPEHIKHGRFGQWLANNVDWALSRDRYWGTPLPIWRCPSGHCSCVSSLAELSGLAGRDLTGIDPHRPAIDAISFDCPSCGQPAQRVEAVIDAWFDSGSMPAAQWGYPHTPGSAERFRFPADLVAEAIDQTRGWFYSLLAVNVLVHGSAPYRHVLCLGHIVDAEGRKMSKSVGNVIDPWAILDSRGADPLRWWMFRQGSPWTATRTSFEAIDASTREFLHTLWNTWAFYRTYADLNRFDPADPSTPIPAERPALDRWARSRLFTTVQTVTGALHAYQPLAAATAINDLVNDVSNWFVRRSRRRFWRTDPDADPADALSAQATLHEALDVISRLLAPFCPFYAEHLWNDLTGAAESASVHLAAWPTTQIDAIDADLEQSMALARRLASLGRSARAQANVKVRQPLRQAIVALPPDHPPLLDDILADELNVDEVTVAEHMDEVVTFELAPNFRLLGPRLGEAVKQLRPALAQLDAAATATRLQHGDTVHLTLGGDPVEVGPEEVEIRIRGRKGFAVSHEATEAVALDLQLDDDLRRRGLLRDIVRQIQELRRTSGLEISDRIHLKLAGLADLEPWAATIGNEVLAVDVAFAPDDGDGEGTAVKSDDRTARAWIHKAPQST
jgi:isoleucyl-tRNA synthetase